MSIANTYAVRTFGFLVYYAAIAAIVVLLIFYGTNISEVVKALLIFLLGGLAQHSGTAFERFANPEGELSAKYEAQIAAMQRAHAAEAEDLRRAMADLERKFGALQAASDARDKEQQRVISNLMNHAYGPVPPYGGVAEPAKRIEDKT